VSDETLVTIQNVSKMYDNQAPHAVENIIAKIRKGQIVGVVGPDGAGKTTLIRLMAGLLKPTTGQIRVAGFDTITQAEDIYPLIGYMPQKFGLYEDLTVMQNLNLYADLKGVIGSEREREFKRLLNFTSLEPFTDRLAGALSGGMKQKLGLACALLHKPLLLLLDEPSVGVDPISRRELWTMVYDLVKEGISVVWSTAYLDEAEKCGSVLLLNEGKLLYHGPPDELTKRASGRTFKLTNIKENRRAVLAKALNQANVLDGVIQGSDVRIVVRKPETNPINLQALGESGIKLESTSPRFEDAFMDILGGGPGSKSVLADIIPEIAERQESIIEAKGLTKKFGDFTAADDTTFTAKSGEIFGLLGPNGAGKSTTFKMLCGLLTPTAGVAYVMRLNLQEAPSQAREQIGYMAQKFSLYGDLSVEQNLEFFSGIYNLRGNPRRQIINKMIEIFNLKDYLDTTSSALPLGFKQRLALSCAVMHHPKVLFLDEPTSGVDPITRREFWTHINGLVEKGVTVMVTTHFMDEAEYCDRVALVYRSKIINMGTPDELKALAKDDIHPSPTLEDAFIKLIEKYEQSTKTK
jgi:ABC-2 type transport system ATP-binding protein